MKCIQCGTDNNLKDRTANSGRCKNCQHPFAFEPNSIGNTKITDASFAKAIADISANNTLFFTAKQLLYLLDRRAKSKTAIHPLVYLLLYIFTLIFSSSFLSEIITNASGNNDLVFVPNLILNIIWIFSLILNSQALKTNQIIRQKYARSLRYIGIFNLAWGIFKNLFDISWLDLAVFTIIGCVEIYLSNLQMLFVGNYQTFIFDHTQLSIWLNRWQKINGNITKMLPFPHPEITPVTVSPDIAAYSFDRLVVCDTAIVARLLIVNNFHFENNCAILSITGYPQSIFTTAMEMLRRNPDLKVYAIHDCSPRGVSLTNHLRNSAKWFLNTKIPIIDIGILPRQVIAAKQEIFIQNSPEFSRDARQLPPAIRSELSPEELAWLDSGNFTELESFSPQKLIQILHHGIAESQNLEDDDSLIMLTDSYASGSDIYLVESFG